MRLLIAFLLVWSAVPVATAQSPPAPSFHLEPSIFEWDDYSTAFAHFYVNVTNPTPERRGYTIGEIDASSIPGPTGNIYSPTPTLVVEAGQTGTFHVWIGGLEQPSPPGPPAGDYPITIKVHSALDASTQASVQGLIRRSHPAPEANAVLAGRVTDAVTGNAPSGTEPILVHVGDPNSVRVLPGTMDTTSLDGAGNFRLEIPPGSYWVRIEGTPYRTSYLGPISIGAGQEASIEASLAPIDAAIVRDTQADFVGDAGLPTYRMGSSLDLRRVATTPGFYTKHPGEGEEQLTLFGVNAQRLWQVPLPPVGPVPFDYSPWTSTDHGLDVIPGGDLIAVGTSGGTIEVYGLDGGPVWKYASAADTNPKVPGPLGEGLRRSSEVRFSPDGSHLAAGSLTGHVFVFNATTGNKVADFTTAGQVRALRFSHDSERLYAGSGDNFLYKFDVPNATESWRAPIGFWPWEHIALNSTGEQIAVGGKDGVMRVFDDQGAPLWSHQFPSFILGYDYTNVGSHLIVLAGNGVYDFAPGGQLRWYRHEIQTSGQLRAVGQFVGYGKASTNPAEATARVLSVNGTLVWEFRAGGTPETIYNVRMLEDGSQLVANGRQGKLYYFRDWLAPDSGTSPSPHASAPPTTNGTPAPSVAVALAVVAWLGTRGRRV